MRLIDQPLPGLEHVTEAQQIERDFAGAWHVWISSAGRWWATRRGRDARWGHDTPPMTVDADDAGGLRAELTAWRRTPRDRVVLSGHSRDRKGPAEGDPSLSQR